jgi:hypothetical protein
MCDAASLADASAASSGRMLGSKNPATHPNHHEWLLAHIVAVGAAFVGMALRTPGLMTGNNCLD